MLKNRYVRCASRPIAKAAHRQKGRNSIGVLLSQWRYVVSRSVVRHRVSQDKPGKNETLVKTRDAHRVAAWR